MGDGGSKMIIEVRRKVVVSLQSTGVNEELRGGCCVVINVNGDWRETLKLLLDSSP
jgi:hypothetical protein